MPYFRCKPSAEEPPLVGELKVFSSDTTGFFNRKLVTNNFDFNNQILYKDVVSGTSVVNYYSKSAYDSGALIQHVSSDIDNIVVGTRVPFMEIDSNNCLVTKGSYAWATVDTGYARNAYTFIPIKHVENVTKIRVTAKGLYSMGHIPSLGFGKFVNGEPVLLGNRRAGKYPYNTNTWYTIDIDSSVLSNVFPATIDWILLTHEACLADNNSLWKELILYNS